MILKKKIFLLIIILICLLMFYFCGDIRIFHNTPAINDTTVDNILQKLRLKHLENMAFKKTASLDDLVIITAFSYNHISEAEKSCRSIGVHKELQNTKVIAYLLENFYASQLETYRNDCPFVEFRRFTFENYPSYVKNLKEYRWKSLIIAEVFREYDLILYVDTSVLFKNVNGSSIKDLITVANTPKYELGTILLSRTGHSIKAATNPKMYKYLPINDTLASKTEMFGATTKLWRKTPMSLEILKSLVICSILPDCLSPMGSYLYCDNDRLSKGEYANCHRFDQSAVNILLVNASNGDTNRYVILNPILKIERD